MKIPFIVIEYSNDFKVTKINLDTSKILGSEVKQNDIQCSHVIKNGLLRNFNKIISLNIINFKWI